MIDSREPGAVPQCVNPLRRCATLGRPAGAPSLRGSTFSPKPFTNENKRDMMNMYQENKEKGVSMRYRLRSEIEDYISNGGFDPSDWDVDGVIDEIVSQGCASIEEMDHDEFLEVLRSFQVR